MACLLHPRFQQYVGCVALAFLGTLLVTWLFYGLFCMVDCGKVATNCTVVNVEAVVKVCQWNNRYYAYTGLVTFEYMAGQTTSVRASCGDDAAAVIASANVTDPLGSTKACWYSVLGDGTLYLSWHAPTAGLAQWLLVNKWYSLVACIGVVACLMLLLAHHVRHGFVTESEERDDLTFP